MSKILIIEDDPILLESLTEFLQEEGMEVIMAVNGKQGVELAAKELPELILCDIFMPKMNGYEAFEKLKSDVNTSLIPFIFLTAKAEREDILYGMTLGADDYITKPIDFDELLVRITKRMEKTRETIRRSEIKYHAVFETAHDAILLIRHADLTIVDANQAALAMLGHSMEELLETSGRRFIKETDLKDAIGNQDEMDWDQKEFHDIETSWRRKDNKQIQIQVSGKLVNLFGERYLFMVARDITEVKEKEKALYESEERNRDLVENIGEGIGIVDREERFTYVNPAACQIFGLANDQLVGRKLNEFLDPGAQEIVDSQSRVRKKGKKSIYELEIHRLDDTSRWLMVTASPQYDIHGVFKGTFGIFRDITERKNYEQQLILAKEKAEESDRLKSSILSNISHELRTPLNGILGFSELLQEDLKNTEYLPMVENIHLSGKRLMSTLNSIITLSQLQAGKVTMVFKHLDLVPAIGKVCQSFEDSIQGKKISLKMELPAEFIVYTDLQLFKQLFLQIFDNAVKFTQKGGITIRAKTVIQDHIQWQTIEIEDTGIGIEQQFFGMIFQEFRQASEGYDRKFQGSGLGLTISKKISELMSGKISVNSTPGKGTTFTIWLPSAQTPKQISFDKKEIDRSLRSVSGGKKRDLPLLLVVEDNMINRNLIELFLKPGYEMDHAYDGKTAVKMAMQKRYDAVLMDIHLGSGIDGIEVTKKIKAITGYEDIPIIAVTGYTMIGDREKLLEEGCTHYIAKPFEKAALLSIIKEAIYGENNTD